jgi:hypothetical protein
MLKSIFKRAHVGIVLLALLIANMGFLPQVFATNPLAKPSIYLTNMNAGGASAVIVEFTTSATNTGTNGSVVFSGWTGSGGTGTVATSQTVTTTYNGVNCKTITLAAANLPGTPTAAGTAGTGTIAVTDATALTASTNYCYVLPTGITANPTSTGQSSVAVTAGTDTAVSVEIDIITNDQVVVSATVPPSFTLGLSGNTDSFTTSLSSGSIVGTTGVTATVGTNAKNGWYLFGSDSNSALNSASTGGSIPATTVNTNTTLTAGTAGYLSGVTAVTQGTGTGIGTTTADAPYSSSGSGNGSGLTTTTPYEMAVSTGTAVNATVTIKEYAAISAVTPAAADYSDTITLVGAGSF